MKEAKDCQDIREIRAIIDEIDYKILASFGKRLEYVEAIVKFKSDPDSIIAMERQLEVLQKRKEWAEEFGLDPDLFTEIYEKLINWNIMKELEIFRSNQKANSL
jgi:isochorismate pyruvate lyase